MNFVKENLTETIILIVDDNLDNLKLLSDMLSKTGYKTRRAISGSLALQALEATKFDLILLDISMAEMDGYQVCQKLKSNPDFANIPVIFISALNDVLDKVKAFNVGGVDYITKPFQIEEVTARVANQIRIINLQNQLQKSNQQLAQNNEKLQLEKDNIKKSQTIIVNNSLKDPITNLNTKITFMGQLRQIIKSATKNNNYNYALLVIRYESFDFYQSIFDSDVEKQCLVAISNEIIKSVPNKNIIGRLNDAEFGIIFQDIEQPEALITTVKKIHQQLKISLPVQGQEILLNPNYGVVLGKANYQEPEQLLYDAHHALIYAFAQGFGNCQVFNQEIKQKSLNNLRLKYNFKQAFVKQEFKVRYQPIINLSTEKLIGIEANMIWHSQADVNSSNNNLSLENLGQIAIDTGLIRDFNNLFLSHICDRLKSLQEVFIWQNDLDQEFEANFKMRFKLSTAQISQSDFPEQIKLMMKKYRIEENRIFLEISLKSLLEKTSIVQQNMARLQQLNLNFSIDNIGTDYVNLIQNNNLAISNLKINQSLINNLESNRVNQQIASNYIAIAHSLRMTVTAEEISNFQQLEILKQQKGDFAIGSYVTKLAESQMKLINQVSF